MCQIDLHFICNSTKSHNNKLHYAICANIVISDVFFVHHLQRYKEKAEEMSSTVIHKS